MSDHDVADYGYDDCRDDQPDAEFVFGAEIDELLPVGQADDPRLLRGKVVSALNQVATYAAHCASPVVAGSLSPYDVTGDKEVLNDYGHGSPHCPKPAGGFGQVSPYSAAEEAQMQASGVSTTPRV